jgi:hypothetical protein
LETLAAGYADPAWVPDKITVAAWSWVGDDQVFCLTTGKDGFFSKRIRGERLAPLLKALRSADVLTGHNILRFDLPVLNAECLRCGLEPLRQISVQDTIKLPRTKGFKKGQDDLSRAFGVKLKKKGLTWTEWDEAYEEDGWPKAVDRCVSDVRQHKELRAKLLDRGVLRERTWRP